MSQHCSWQSQGTELRAAMEECAVVAGLGGQGKVGRAPRGVQVFAQEVQLRLQEARVGGVEVARGRAERPVAARRRQQRTGRPRCH